jgi:[ribosomal protein S5]-alanine N-acetyltransferase
MPRLPMLQSDRLTLWQLDESDAPFILRLLNEPSWLEHIGDKGVRTAEDAKRYIADGPVEMYRRSGLGLYLVRLSAGHEPIGLCGLLRRETLEDVDLGFAFLPEFWGKGYAHESAAAVLAQARKTLGIRRIVAITKPGNGASRKVLEKLGFAFERPVRLGMAGDELLLYANTA